MATPHPEPRRRVEGPTATDLVAAMRELVEAFAAPAVDDADEERCLRAILRQKVLLDRIDGLVEPSELHPN